MVANIPAYTADRAAWGRTDTPTGRTRTRFKSLFNAKALPANIFKGSGFFGSKLGQAAIASTFAMTAMVVLTTQVDEASAASIAAPHADHVIVEIA